MKNNTWVGVDLAKNIIQVCIVKSKKVFSNIDMRPEEFKSWLARSKPATIIFEACGTANYWQQIAIEYGHDAKQINAKLVAMVRQNQKTDKNDALAIAQACQLPDVKFVSGKTFKQQELQTIVRMKELTTKHKVATQNQIRALLLEFGIKTSARSSLGRIVGSVLEDGENGFSIEFRRALSSAWQLLSTLIKTLAEHDKALEKLASVTKECKTFMALEGVGPLNAVNLYMLLVCGEQGTFRSGRDASACVGLTPIQHSTGGKVKLGSIGRHIKNHSMRSTLVSGAMSVCNHVSRREPKTEKEVWLKSLMERKGKRCAAVALANKTVRTAFALIAKETEYQATALAA